MIKMHCDLCDRVIPVKEVSGDHYKVVIKKKTFGMFMGWDTTKIDACNLCMKRIYEVVV